MCHWRTAGIGRGDSLLSFQFIHLVALVLFASLTCSCVSFVFSFQPLQLLQPQPQSQLYYHRRQGRSTWPITGTTQQKQHQLQSSNTSTEEEEEEEGSSSSSNESIEDTLSKLELQKIEASRSLIMKRKVKITAVPAYVDTDTNTDADVDTLVPGSRNDDDDDDDDENGDNDDDTKIIHFQRHGQGTHNVLYQSWTAAGNIIDWDSKDPQFNPLLSDDIIDAPLTEVGIQQCIDSRLERSVDRDLDLDSSSSNSTTIPHSNYSVNPQLIIVSPLQRAIQSAELSWEAWKWDTNNTNKRTRNSEVRGGVPPPPTPQVPWIAHEGCREEVGLLKCNKRRMKSVMEQEYPTIDFRLVMQEEDHLFLHDRRETDLEKTNRVYEFLTQYVRHVPQREMVVVGHSAWLFNMCNAVMDIPKEHHALTTWFATAEIRSMKVTFSDIDSLVE